MSVSPIPPLPSSSEYEIIWTDLPATRRCGEVNVNIVRNPRLSPQAKGLYAFLATYADRYNEVCMTRIVMAQKMGCSQKSIVRWLAELQRLDVVERVNRTCHVLRDFDSRVVAS